MIHLLGAGTRPTAARPHRFDVIERSFSLDNDRPPNVVGDPQAGGCTRRAARYFQAGEATYLQGIDTVHARPLR
jgi:hypothetical protein